MSRVKVGEQLNLQEAVEYISAKDKRLAKIIKVIGPCKLLVNQMQSTFEALAESIVYQQLTGKAAATIFGRVKSKFSDSDWLEPQHILAVEEEHLRGAGCSRAKALALIDLAEKSVQGFVPSLAQMDKMSDDELVEKLSSIRGIGKWTVEMLLIFRLGRLDVLPATDYGIRKGFAYTYGMDDLPTPKQILEKGERWRPYRTVASWYLWRSCELIKSGVKQ